MFSLWLDMVKSGDMSPTKWHKFVSFLFSGIFPLFGEQRFLSELLDDYSHTYIYNVIDSGEYLSNEFGSLTDIQGGKVGPLLSKMSLKFDKMASLSKHNKNILCFTPKP